MRILLLDDDIPFLDSFGDLLSQEGHSVFPATRGLQAVEIVRRVPIDLSFLDFDLPDQSGVETLVEIRRELPELPAVFISGNPSETLERTILSCGGFALLRKPFDPRAVRGVLHRVIDNCVSYNYRPIRLRIREKEIHDGETQDSSPE